MKPSDSASRHVEAAHAVGRGDHRNAQRVRELGQLLARLRQRHAVADEEHRALRLRGSCRARRVTSSGEAPLRWAPCRGAAGGTSTSSSSWNTLNGTSTFTGPGPARQHRGHRLAQRQRQHVDAGRLEAALDHRADDVGEVGLEVPVDLLERAAVELRGRHVGGDREQGRGIRQRHRSGMTMLQEPGPQEVSVATGSWRTRK